MNSEVLIQVGSKVLMHFSLCIENGLVADSTQDEEPMEFVMGDGSLIQGLELALLGLKAGDKQSLTIDPDLAYGYRDPANVHNMDTKEFPQEMELRPGTVIGFTTPAGDELPGTIIAVDGARASVDFNHPLAGHTLTFDVEILSVQNEMGNSIEE